MSAISSAQSRTVLGTRGRTAALRATWFVYKWELLKLRAQKRTYLGLGAATLVPIAFVVALTLKSGGPRDIPLGRYLRESGLATPFVVLEFMAIWGLPLITALVAGDIVASESHNGTAGDDPHSLARTGRGLRRQAPRDRHVHSDGGRADGRYRARGRDCRMGLEASRLPLRAQGVCGPQLRSSCSQPSASTCSRSSGSPP